MAKELVSIKIDRDTYNKLKELAHPGQSLNGIIQELINKVKKK